ncbi:hypothetical protein KB996_003221 [Vibrio parahaemolyticus]|uniref:hypothetical protein n=1 Tax=Vibrio TaxID=662 RepID=UPI000BF556B3|nr:hypothetical protein [Vibrio sp. ES.051]EHK0062301.1 hypothetical protein [Vibrio parahaemolyticus]PFG45977.1 hypothetical protein ATG66_3068 [Vibrio sp. ES.051]
MSYLDTLIEMKDKVEASSDLQANHKIILIQLIENERAVKNAEEDPFDYFYKNISSREDIFDFQSKLGESYGLAQGHADCCIKIFSDFSKLEPNIKLQNWLSSAIRTVDCIVIHYLQEVLNEEPIAQDGKGKERSRYIQINRQGVKAHKAGSIMDHLYGERNKMEHQVKKDPVNPNKQIIVPPKYNKILKNINKKFPDALISFDNAYKDHYH